MIARRSLHILMTADAVGGVWQYALTLAGELTSAGHRVTLALLGPSGTEEQREQAARISDLELVETGLPLDWLNGGPSSSEVAARELARMADRLNADIIQLNSPALAGAARFSSPVVAVAHGCVATWWQAAKHEPLGAQFEWHKRMVGAGLRAADAVVAPSESFARILQSTYSLPRSPMAVHNGRAPLYREEEPRQLDVGLTIGRLWDLAKNAAVLDQAAAGNRIPIIAAGALDGPHGETFVPRHMHALGHQSEAALAHMLALRPVFLSAASFEPFGLAVLEAASAGCALVLSDIAVFRELWKDTAVFVPSDDAQGFAAALEDLIADPRRRRALGEAARERSARYTPAATATAMTHIYEHVLANEEVAA